MMGQLTPQDGLLKEQLMIFSVAIAGICEIALIKLQ
jgi:hypothetical protein